ncbi:MFS transporter [Paenibacillus rhizophilus]|nr:MFS transporter [Paenibacillus rhizophilus]
MKQRDGSFTDQNWLRSFMFSIYGTSVLAVSYFPLFYSHLGFSSAQVGYLYSLGPLISILSNLFWSMISDRFGTIRKIMVILLGGQLATAVLLSQASEFSSVMVILSFFYFFYYPVFPLSDTMAIKIAERRGRNFISIRVFGSIGYAFFALTIGYLLRALGTSWSVYLCIIIIIMSLFTAWMLQDSKPEKPNRTTNKSAMEDALPTGVKSDGLRQILFKKEVLWFFGCVFVLALGHRMNEAFLTVSMKQLGAGAELIGWALLFSALSEIPVLFLLGKYGDRFKELPLLALASLMYAVRFLLMSSVHHPGGMIAIQLMHSITFGVFYVTAVRYITRIIPDHLRATGMAIFTVIWSSVSGLLSGTFGGIIFQEAGLAPFYRIAMLLSIVACAGFFGKYWVDSDSESALVPWKRLSRAKRPEAPASHTPADASHL